MTLPPLPAAAYVYKKHHDPVYDAIYFTADQMRKYGQQCREDALEEAAKACEGEQWVKSSSKTVGYMYAFNEGCESCEETIRSLK